ncbi:peptide chain release factor N(5)-glutamine methyltransferase [Staphylococcus intermedius]|uniref:Release factor glutamine methyltransferase n=1 Tax=Staphylococcus intermedius NCTC 11048 TaxID=1141106 RepID=A0A380G6P6_STAIN|nr:peptide chain release factor N(5)-glutamine methyltransferase [Staphylococcus intermedius]PCF62836.1 protein-(glutamine-N5) methyltransferase, release factor-specific [Staphylococcus intermedius]PCF77948.1 protein-(glutamine-N5) methyltransferase, release factor-specific [Staphylococcus intermedius]PCF78300.1 protein-(glutamine-N5) methyltransferase, release factor-specific [Staphylococcus intermedius]PCF85324.1 protein-(glutamine-N5) methyltransferase, release factor-specific [Staphylococcu
MNYKQWRQHAEQQMRDKGYDVNAIQWFLMDTMQWSRTSLILNEMTMIPETTRTQLDEGLTELLTGMPVQYVVGQAEFYGRPFKVNSDVLIPRPETEEVVQYFLNQLKDATCVADIGVGSGAIAVTLKAERPELHVFATDISSQALTVAQENAQRLQQDITFLQGNALQPLIDQGIRLDGLISNPPYIGEHERDLMDVSVIQYEPHVALFAEQEGYQVYAAILRDLPYVMQEGAPVVFEIGFQQGVQLTRMMQQLYPHITTNVINDINGHARIFHFKWRTPSSPTLAHN